MLGFGDSSALVSEATSFVVIALTNIQVQKSKEKTLLSLIRLRRVSPYFSKCFPTHAKTQSNAIPFSKASKSECKSIVSCASGVAL